MAPATARSLHPTPRGGRPDGAATDCPTDSFNIAAYLPDMAAIRPDRPAVIVAGPAGDRLTQVTFDELERLTNRYANGLVAAGFGRGMRTLLMVRPGVDFIALVYALFKVGAVPVLIDPGMGAGRMLECLGSVDVQGFIGIPLSHVMRLLRPGPFRTVSRVVTVGRRWGWGGPTLAYIARSAADTFELAPTDRGETAAILFTSGATGPAKGVVYEHGMFDTQVRTIQAAYNMEPGEVDLPTFPLFALFSTAMGMTSVIPRMDPSRPGKVDPAGIVNAILAHNVTTTFGSPALWRRVADYCAQRRVRLPSLRRILIAGAPVSTALIEDLHRALTDEADVHTPYGATESLPVASIAGRQRLGEGAAATRSGAGICVGRPLDGIDLRIIRIIDQPIDSWGDDLIVPDGEIGEIAVAGEVVTKAYFGRPDATRLAKIHAADRVWHRIGDVGYRGRDGRIWFCGRKAHRVVTPDGVLFSVCCEAIFNEHPHVARSALVGIGPRDEQRPVIVVEPARGRFPKRRRTASFRSELLALGRENLNTRPVLDVLFHHRLPVDIRHNAKINREALAEWAAKRLP